MESDPAYPMLEDLMEACPAQAGTLLMVYRDIALSQEWIDIRALELGSSGWCALLGHKKAEDVLRLVVPLPLHTTSLTPSALKSIFKALSSLSIFRLPPPLPSQLEGAPIAHSETKPELDKETIYLGIVATDSTVVYYKLSKGIKKPADVPDE